jgi:hypothetical protein
LSSIYIFIPGNISIAKTIFPNCSEAGAIRSLADETKWEKWWPVSGKVASESFFVYNNIRYHLGQRLYNDNGILVLIETDDLKIQSRISVYHIGSESIAIEWTGSFHSSLNPAKKLHQYYEAKIIQNNMSDILQSMRVFLDKRENIYGISIKKTTTKDTLLIYTNSIFTKKPTPNEVYGLINILKSYALTLGSRQDGYPLLNVTELGPDSFHVKVALPVDKYLKGTDKIESKRMVPGNFLMSEITGGEGNINNAYNQIKLFMHDYGKTEVAIPFESLVTDRTIETDSSKWVTKIYQPIY